MVAISLSTNQTIDEDGTIQFDVDEGNGIVVSGVSPSSTQIVVTIWASDGSFNVASAGNLVVHGQSTSLLTISGSLADVNAALDGLTYTGAPDVFGSRTISVSVSDGVGSATGNTVVTIADVNDAPRLSGFNGDNASFTEGQQLVRLDVGGNATVSDVDQYGFESKLVGSGLAAGGPVFIAPVPDNSGRVFVVEQRGVVSILDPATGQFRAEPLLDLSGTIPTAGEEGLLAFTTAPDFATSGNFYVYLTNNAGNIEVRRYQTSPSSLAAPSPEGGDLIIEIPHPGGSSHNGGWIGFASDGYLYIATGDVGRIAPDFYLSTNAQDPNTLLGKILRIDVSTDAFPGDDARDYAIPSDNPFATSGGAPEIFALGLRNPWRASFDPDTGSLYIGDVGEAAREEVNVLPLTGAGTNFGWSVREGTIEATGPDDPSFTGPALEYTSHLGGPLSGISVTGGYVYRGPIEELNGQYIFSDLLRNIWSVPVEGLLSGETLGPSDFRLLQSAFSPQSGSIFFITSFGVDQANNLYVADWADGEIYRIEESATPNLAGGSLTATISANKVASEDRLGFDVDSSSGVTLSDGMNAGSAVRVAGTLVGHVATGGTGSGDNPLLIYFTGGATAAAVQTLVRALSYSNSNVDNPTAGTRTITVVVQDGAGSTGGGTDSTQLTAFVQVTAVNDAGVAINDQFTVSETAQVTGNLFADNGFGVDVDHDDVLAIGAVNGNPTSVGQQITLASGALLTVNADGTFSYDTNDRFNLLAAPGSGATNISTAEAFTYTLATGGTAQVLVVIQGIDGDDALFGSSGADVLQAGQGADFLFGYEGDDQLFGGTGNDHLEGGLSADLMDGGSGDDTYFVDNLDDRVSEADGGGNDTVYASTDYQLRPGSAVETLWASELTLSANLFGNEFGNNLLGNSRSNMLNGMAGADYLFGFAGDDVLSGGDGTDFVDGGDGEDFLFGGEGDDTLVGGAGRDFLSGVLGSNVLYGGLGDDTYIVDASDFVVEQASEGFDTVYSSVDYQISFNQSIEVLTAADRAATSNLSLAGNAFDNIIWGNAGANVLWGHGGNDTLLSFDGADGILGGSGNDLLDGGAGADSLHGEAGADTLVGGGDDDFLSGGLGTDLMMGGAGNDVFIVENPDDVIVEEAGGGTDLVYAPVSYALSAGAEVETLSAGASDGTADIDLTGNEFANTLSGNAGVNVLSGKAGSDLLLGYGGSDEFVFSDAPGVANIDRIGDFQSGSDRIVLDRAVFAGLATGSLTASAFVIGSAASNGDHRLIYDSASGALFYDQDGNGLSGAQQFAWLGANTMLAASDFLIV